VLYNYKCAFKGIRDPRSIYLKGAFQHCHAIKMDVSCSGILIAKDISL